jgi:cell division septum initiation protein DivIVA
MGRKWSETTHVGSGSNPEVTALQHARLIEDVKARAAANPAAALAIGAGIAWRLIHRPPIATALVGAGLISLFRTPPARPNGQAPPDYLAHAKTRLREQASAAADVAQEKAAVLSETVAEKVTETAGRMKERAQDLTAQARLAATNIARDTRQQATAMLNETTDALEQVGQSARSAASSAVSRANAAMEQRWQPLQAAVSNAEARDKFLLAAAGLAVFAALGIASRRISERAETD